jgi:hypothetical protein
MLMHRYSEIDTMRGRLRGLREQLFYLLTSVLQVRGGLFSRCDLGLEPKLTLPSDPRRLEHDNERHRIVQVSFIG